MRGRGVRACKEARREEMDRRKEGGRRERREEERKREERGEERRKGGREEGREGGRKGERKGGREEGERAPKSKQKQFRQFLLILQKNNFSKTHFGRKGVG